MKEYVDGFAHPVAVKHLNEYKRVAEKVAGIWKEYGALAYFEYVGDDMILEGTRTFNQAVSAKEKEVVIFGWVVFPSKEVRDDANQKVPNDPRMNKLVTPLIDPKEVIFDPARMLYGGFAELVKST